MVVDGFRRTIVRLNLLVRLAVLSRKDSGYDDLNHSRPYPNLDTVAEMGSSRKANPIDGRSAMNSLAAAGKRSMSISRGRGVTNDQLRPPQGFTTKKIMKAVETKGNPEEWYILSGHVI
jgi:hypothetical protein